jgi:hypothetical protein
MDTREQLLKRILASRQFAHADTLKRILQYLYEYASRPDDAPLKEHDIAVNAIGRSRDFDARLDPIVRVSMLNLRARLKAFFETEGVDEALCLDVPKGQYRAVFQPRTTSRQSQAQRDRPDALRKFWEPYLLGVLSNVLLYSELLFFRDRFGNFRRSLYVNDPLASDDVLKNHIPDAEPQSLKPCYNFLSAGEARCMLSLVAMFQALGAAVESRNARSCSWLELQQSNVILLGSSRTTSLLDRLQGGEDLILMEDRIEMRHAEPHEDKCYKGHRYSDGKLEKAGTKPGAAANHELRTGRVCLVRDDRHAPANGRVCLRGAALL